MVKFPASGEMCQRYSCIIGKVILNGACDLKDDKSDRVFERDVNRVLIPGGQKNAATYKMGAAYLNTLKNNICVFVTCQSKFRMQD